MVFNPFDYNEANRHRRDSVEDRLREGSPVVGVSFDEGLLILTVRRTQRKVFEIYDRIIYSAIGNQSDVEAIRVGAIDVAHKEGFDRSPDDVTTHRLVSFSLSPPLKRIFGDTFNAQPAVIRAMFGELGKNSEQDVFYVLNYDGEFSQSHGFAVVGGTQEAEDKMSLSLMGVSGKTTLKHALDRGLNAWSAGAAETKRKFEASDDDNEAVDEETAAKNVLREELKLGTVEVGVLDRNTNRESKFRLFGPAELDGLLSSHRRE